MKTSDERFWRTSFFPRVLIAHFKSSTLLTSFAGAFDAGAWRCLDPVFEDNFSELLGSKGLWDEFPEKEVFLCFAGDVREFLRFSVELGISIVFVGGIFLVGDFGGVVFLGSTETGFEGFGNSFWGFLTLSIDSPDFLILTWRSSSSEDSVVSWEEFVVDSSES